MASLTHVCMWSGNGWKRITAEQAAKLHPGGTVSAHSGLFMCELCGQYVTLTDGDIRERYFKHSAYEKSKDCPERTFGAGYSSTYSPQEHDLPIRIVGISSTTFHFELGLIRAPVELLNRDFRIKIIPKDSAGSSFLYTKERFQPDRITYLPIGDHPYESYILELQNGDSKLRAFWPEKVRGIDPDGTLFDKATGKKLTHDADVEIGKDYYLLKRGFVYQHSSESSLSIHEISRKSIGWETWRLYTISATAFTEETARFFLDCHCRLTEHPIALMPVWPLFTEGSYVIKHNQNSIYMLVNGNASSIKTFPSASIRQLSESFVPSRLYEIFCSSRQQLISAGRVQALQYTYFWKEQLDQGGSTPSVSVTDLSGAEIIPGETTHLPADKTMFVKSSYDGEIIFICGDRVSDRRKLSAGKSVELTHLSYGSSIQVFVGLDCIWEIQFHKPSARTSENEAGIMKQLTNVSGSIIPVPHALYNILLGMSDYPLICQWVRKQIKTGTINEQSYRRLQDIYHKTRTDKSGDLL